MTHPVATLKQWADLYIKDTTFTVVPENMPKPHTWGKGARHFYVTLVGERGVFATYYSVGPGIVEMWVKEHYGSIGPKDNPFKPNTVAYVERVCSLGKKFRPDVVDILECLASDFQGLDCSYTFEEWAEVLGYDSDSRAAERIYNTILDQWKDFRTAFGETPASLLIDIDPNQPTE